MHGGGPARGGTRGGKDQFDWENVKGDKDREYYLGHSVKASVGRWQKGRDILWYTRDKKADDGGAAAEVAAIKAAEEQAMAEALGLRPRTERANVGGHLEQRELDELFKRGRTDEDRDDKDKEASRIKGLGNLADMQRGGGAGREVMAGIGMDDDDDGGGGSGYGGGREYKRMRLDVAGGGGASGGIGAAPLSAKEQKKIAKKEKKAAKKAKKKLAKKERKAEKKSAKKAKKRAKREARGESPSSSSSSSFSSSSST